MRIKQQTRIFLFFVFLFTGVLGPKIFAKVSFRIESYSVYENQPVVGTLSVENEKEEYYFNFPEIEGLEFESSGKTNVFTSTTNINGKVTKISRYTLRFYIHAKEPGSYKVEGITVETAQGINKTIPAFDVQFQKIPENKNLKIEVLPLKKAFYPNERTELKIAILYNGVLEDYRIRFDLFDRAKDLDLALIPSHYQNLPATRRFKLGNYEIPFVNRPDSEFQNRYEAYVSLSPRDQEIPSAYLEAIYRYRNSIRSVQDRALVKSEAFSIPIKSFPQEGKPSSFRGAVGKNFTLAASVGTRSYQVQTPIPVKIKITSEDPIYSDLRAIPQESENFSVGESKDFEKNETSVAYVTEMQAAKEGDFTLPPIEFSYFNPEEEKYHALTSKAIPIKIIPAIIFDESDIYIPDTGKSSESENLRPVPADQILSEDSPHSAQVLGAFIGPPLLSLFILSGIGMRKTFFSPEKRAANLARKKIEAQIRELETMENSDEFISKFSEIFGNILYERLQIRNRYAISEISSEQLPPDIREEITAIQKILDEAGYSPTFSSSETGDLLKRLKRVLPAIEKFSGPSIDHPA